MAKIIVENILAEDLFQWFESNINDSGGDGTGQIVCSNYKEVAFWFRDWWANKNGLDEKGDKHCEVFGKPHIVHYGENRFPHPPDITENCINFHDWNENYIFTNDESDLGSVGDYTFVVKGDCVFAFDPRDKARVIKAI